MQAVETAENNCLFRQSAFRPRRPFLRNDTFAIVGLITRQTHNILGIIDLVTLGNDPVIGNDIMVIGAAGGPRVSWPWKIGQGVKVYSFG